MTENISLKNETFEKHPDYGGFITHGGHHRVHGSFYVLGELHDSLGGRQVVEHPVFDEQDNLVAYTRNPTWRGTISKALALLVSSESLKFAT